MARRRFGPLSAEHPIVSDGSTCAACTGHFHPGQYVTLVALGPGADPLERQRANDGHEYTAVTIPVHWACAVGEDIGTGVHA